MSARVRPEALDRVGPAFGTPRRLQFKWRSHPKAEDGWCSLCRNQLTAGVCVAHLEGRHRTIDIYRDAHHFICMACVASMTQAAHGGVGK